MGDAQNVQFFNCGIIHYQLLQLFAPHLLTLLPGLYKRDSPGCSTPGGPQLRWALLHTAAAS